MKEDKFYFLTEKNAIKLPTPKYMKNHGNYIISLGELCRWLAQEAQNLGIEIYTGNFYNKYVIIIYGRYCWY